MTNWSPYTRFRRAEWARLRADAALTLTPEDVRRPQGLNEPVAMDEVVAVYLPLARLLGLYVEAERAHLVLVKNGDHCVDEVWLRKL